MKDMRTLVRLALVGAMVASVLALPLTSFANHVVVKATANDTWNESYNHVAPGTRVVWKNPERLGAPHDLTSYGRNWDKSVFLEPGEQTAKRFRKTGTYKYRCRLHSSKRPGEQCKGMCGVIHVAR
jgi:plastocyanin